MTYRPSGEMANVRHHVVVRQLADLYLLRSGKEGSCRFDWRLPDAAGRHERNQGQNDGASHPRQGRVPPWAQRRLALGGRCRFHGSDVPTKRYPLVGTVWIIESPSVPSSSILRSADTL
jgi:hypothetical protein